MINYIKKWCFLSIPIITSFIFLIIYNCTDFFNNLNSDDSTTIQISGTMIGFLLTAITIFLSLPKNTEYMKRIKKYKHDKIFAKCIFVGLLVLTADIIIWILKVPSIYITWLFIIGLEETLISAYYIYRLCVDNF